MEPRSSSRCCCSQARRKHFAVDAHRPRVHKGQTDRSQMSQGCARGGQAMADMGLVVGVDDEC